MRPALHAFVDGGFGQSVPVGWTRHMHEFRFAPELFEVRTAVMERLSEEGFDWLSHYSAVDPIHDEYGIEVCGIRYEEDAVSILRMLVRMFPTWQPC